MSMRKECFLTWNRASFSAVTPATIPPSLISRATPGPVISVVIKECQVPCALVVSHFLARTAGLKLEWEDALLSSGRLALRSSPHLGGQGDEEEDGEAVALGEGDEGRLHDWKQRCRLISYNCPVSVLAYFSLVIYRNRNPTGKVFCLARDESVLHTHYMVFHLIRHLGWG